ncbi:MAG TPA: ABC transporter substrate-binding protein, partial [Pseudolabrys sp.]
MSDKTISRRTALQGGASLIAAPAVLRVIPAHAQSKTIKIGHVSPRTGPLAAFGEADPFILEQINKLLANGIQNGGKTYKVEIVYVDYESNTPRAVQSAERLITSDKVNFLFSPFGSGAAKAASSVSERYRIPTIAATASSVEVYDQGYKYLFGTFTPNDTLTNPLADIVSKSGQNVKTIAIYARNDLFPRAIAKEMEKSAKARGIEVLS